MNRRSFFSKCLRAAAIVALAPQIAFRVKPDLPTLTYRANFGVYEQLRACENVIVREPLDLQAFFKLNYDIMRARQKEAA